LSTLHQRWWWNDPDCLLVRDQQTSLTEVEMLSNVSLVGLSGGMLVSSDDLRHLNPARFKLVSLLVPNLGVRGLPIDLLEHEMPELYQLKLQAAGQVWQDVALFNWSDHPAGVRLRFDRLGFVPGIPLHVFDFWEKRYTLVTDGELAYADIPAHGCKLLRVCAKVVDPQVVGDTLHITQGAELASFLVEGGRLVIETVDMRRRVEGELWLSFPSEPKMATCNQKVITFDKRGECIYILPLQFSGKGRIEVHM
jgi:alpha-galactosidase